MTLPARFLFLEGKADNGGAGTLGKLPTATRHRVATHMQARVFELPNAYSRHTVLTRCRTI